MKRTSLFMAVLLLSATAILLPYCKKGDRHSISIDNKIPEQVNNWLEKQKSPTQPKKAANVDLLRKHLDYSRLRYEQLSDDQQFLIIPLNEGYKVSRKIKNNPDLSLLLVIDKSGTITRGNLVSYTAADGEASCKTPANSFYSIHNSRQLACSGKFRFMSATGTMLYELVYKDGNIQSYAKMQAKKSNGDANASVETVAQEAIVCTAWYLVTTTYVNGVVVSEVWDYITTTCSGCDNDQDESHCMDDGGGGGGGGEGELECCVPPNVNRTTTMIQRGGPWECGPETIENGVTIKKCKMKWEFNKESLLGYNWSYYTWIYADIEKVNGAWKFKSINPSINVLNLGNQPPCITFSCSGTMTPTITADRNRVHISIDWHSTGVVNCFFGRQLPPKSGSISWTYELP